MSLANIYKDGDWVIREAPEACDRVLAVLESRGALSRAPLAPGEEARLQCGTGMPAAGWFLMVFLHVTSLNVWLEREAA